MSDFINSEHIYHGTRLKWDEDGVMDVPVGEEFQSRQGKTEYQEERTYVADDRLQKLVNVILEEAIRAEASDIMIEPKEFRGLVSFRIDGAMQAVRDIHPGAMRGITAVFQDRAGLSLGNYQTPSIDGRITHNYRGRNYEFRMAGFPSLFGFTIDLRLLSTKGVPTDIGSLGLPDMIVQAYRQSLNLREGLVVFAGGTSSGKSTSIVAGLNEALTKFAYEKKLLTVENPVEYVIPDATQTSINPSAGYSFTTALQTFLRSDPDMIFVGEINDDATAGTVARASGTGHLVFTTLHANSALEVPDALLHYDVGEKQVFQTLRLIIYQVLKPKICTSCSRPRPLKDAEKRWADENLLTTDQLAVVREPNFEGCSDCRNGYQGMVVMGEMLVSNALYRDLRNEVQNNNWTQDKLKKQLMEHEGILYYPLEFDVFRRLKNGEISFTDATSLVGK